MTFRFAGFHAGKGALCGCFLFALSIGAPQGIMGNALAGDPGVNGDPGFDGGLGPEGLGAAEDILPGRAPARAGPVDAQCDSYARAYADRYLGSGDPTGDIVSGAMGGAVAGGAWEGQDGERRGAAVGGALAVLDNLASYPGGWEGIYDMAYQMCAQEKMNARAAGCPGASGAGSSAGVVSGKSDPLRATSRCQ